MTDKTYTPDELLQFVIDVNESTMASDDPKIKHAFEVSAPRIAAFRQAFMECVMMRTLTADQWFNAEDGFRKNWASMIIAAKRQSDALDEADAKAVTEQVASPEQSPVMDALLQIAAGIAELNTKMGEMMTKEEPAAEEPAPAPPAEEPAPAPAEDEQPVPPAEA